MEAHGDFQGEWDEGRMGQLLSNMLENALTYGDRDRPVTVTLDGLDNHVSLAVHNSGPVIPPKERERIFEPRNRGPAQQAQRAPDGLGLGLYICREITRAHNGTLSVRSDADEGTTFLARMPRHRDASVAPDLPA